MSSRPDIHIRASFFTLHCDIFRLDIISSLFFDITYHHLWYSFSVFSFPHWLLDIILVSPWVVVFHTSLHGELWWFWVTWSGHSSSYRVSLSRGRTYIDRPSSYQFSSSRDHTYIDRSLSCQFESGPHLYDQSFLCHVNSVSRTAGIRSVIIVSVWVGTAPIRSAISLSCQFNF